MVSGVTRVTKTCRRSLGILCLVTAVGLLAAGDRSPGGRLGNGLGFVAYWLLCFLCCMLAVVVAWWDPGALRREVREQQRALLDDALGQLRRPEQTRSPGSGKDGLP